MIRNFYNRYFSVGLMLVFTSFINAQNLNFTIDVCGAAVTELRLVGPIWNNWDPNSGPAGTDNGDGTWNVTVTDNLTSDLEYLVSLNGAYENLIATMQNGGNCAPITDYFSYANRLYQLGSADTMIAYGRCVPCNYPDFTITTEVCAAATSVRMTGPRWNWDPNVGPIATSLGNNMWQFSFAPALDDTMEYLLLVDGVMENLVPAMQNGGDCAPITDYFSYANRRWVLTDGSITNTYNRCVPCSFPNLTITTEVCTPATSVKMTGPRWNWDPNIGPVATSLGNDMWQFSFTPALADSMEYLIIADDVMENLVPAMLAGGTCAPVTDFATYANRRWVVADGGSVSNTYGKCTDCNSNSLSSLEKSNIVLYPNPTNDVIHISSEEVIKSIKITNLVGEEIITKVSSSATETLSVANLNKGLYFITIETDQKAVLNSSFIVK